MRPTKSIKALTLLAFCGVLAGCNFRFQAGSQIPPPGSAPVVLAMTDTPPTNVSFLSAEVTLTGATLNPGNVSLLTTPATLEITRLQTDIAYLSKTNVNAGNYTSLVLTFANPSLTIENDTGSAIVSGGTTCNIGSICTIPPTTIANLSTTITIPTLAISANTGAGLLVDLNLDKLFSATLGADFKTGATVSEFSPGGSGAPLVGAEDVVGQVGSIDTIHNTFSFKLQSSLPPPSLPPLTVDSMTTKFFNFPAVACTTPSFQCLKDGQIVSVDISIRFDGTALARNVLFEDSDSSKTEVEGIITSTNVGPQQFTIVAVAESAAFGGPLFGTSGGLTIGEPATVTYTVATTFDLDFTHADTVQVDSSCCLFRSPADLSVGQQVQVRAINNVPGNSITVDRVRLRSSRITATVQPPASNSIPLTNVPSIFSGHSVTQIQAQTFPGITIFSENNNLINISLIPNSGVVSVRGPLFNVSGARTLVATKVVLKP